MKTVFSEYDFTQERLEERVNKLKAHNSKSTLDKAFLKRLLGMLDLTTLEGSDNRARVIALCKNARFSSLGGDFPDAAAVCIYPSLVRIASQELAGSGIRVAAVAGGFPAGLTSLAGKLDEIRYAIDEGAEEIDTVISRGKLLEGNYNEVFDELAAMREACGSVHLKIILETGELSSIEWIRKASEISIMAGADFIKTSTGKIPAGATPLAFLVMLDTIKEYLEKTGKTVGIKAAGGVRTPEQALMYAGLFTHVLGQEMLRKDLFRIGASSLAGEILTKL